MVNLENGVRHLQTIFSAGPMVLNIRATFFKRLLWQNPHLTPLRPKIWPNCNILSHASELSFSVVIIVLIVREIFWSSYREILTYPHHKPKYGQFAKCRRTPPNHSIQLISRCLPPERNFRTLIVKFWLNRITTQKMANLRNPVNRRQIIVFSSSYFSYNQRDVLELLLWNSHLTPLRAKYAKCRRTPTNYPIQFVLLFLSSERHFGTLMVKHLLNPITTKKMANLQNPKWLFSASLRMLIQRHFGTLTVKFWLNLITTLS